MAQDIILSALMAIVIAGGIRYTFRDADPSSLHARTLFVVGLVSITATLILILDISGAGLSGIPGSRIPVVVLSSTLPGLLYVLAGLGFRRSWHTSHTSFVLIALIIISGSVLRLMPGTASGIQQVIGLSFKVLTSICLLHVLASLWSGRRDDMDSWRLRARYPLAGLVAVCLATTLIVSQASPWPAGLLVASWILMAGSVFTIRRHNASLRLEDGSRLEDLLELFGRRRIYREEDLTLERIGDRLLLDNEEVRALIHRGLGFRRLGDLLDDYRIKAALVILEDIDQVETGLTDVALSVGYSSLLPFEAAFRRQVGETPKAYRQLHLEKANANRPLQLTNSDR
jgi:AraC-like DNA-binding protein